MSAAATFRTAKSAAIPGQAASHTRAMSCSSRSAGRMGVTDTEAVVAIESSHWPVEFSAFELSFAALQLKWPLSILHCQLEGACAFGGRGRHDRAREARE